MAKQRYYFSDRLARRQRNIKLGLAALFILVISAGTAFSSERDDRLPAPSSPPLSVTDSCVSLLQSIRHQASNTVPDRNQRTAGHEAAPLIAAGLVFGVRFALGPLEQASYTHPARAGASDALRISDTDTVSRNALAVAAWRQCEKQQALTTALY